MFASCLRAAPRASAEVVQTKEERSGSELWSPRTAISRVVQTETMLGGELVPNPESAFSRQLDRMKQDMMTQQKCASSCYVSSSGSTGERDLDTDLDGPASRQISSEHNSVKLQAETQEERFPCWTRLPYSVPAIGNKELSVLNGLESAAVQNFSRPHCWPRETSEVGSAQTKEERLHAQVHDFVSKARKGMSVYLCDMESLLLSQCLFRIDETTTTLTLQTALAPERELKLKNLTSVVKDEAFKKRAPRLAHASGECLLLAFGDAVTETLHCLFFQDTSDRNDFHTNMKVVRVMATRGAM
jgi:hypothetical protein